MNEKFVNTMKQGIIGAILGLISGHFLGIFIFLLQYITDAVFVSGQTYDVWIKASQPAVLGACVGAIIGGIFGAISALKNKQNK